MYTAMLACVPECGCTLACSAPKSCFGAIDGQLLGDVHKFAAAVVALARIALGVFVGEHRAHRFEHRFGDEILRGDQLDAGGLPPHFVADRLGDLGIDFVQRAAHSFKFARFVGHFVGLHHIKGCL